MIRNLKALILAALAVAALGAVMASAAQAAPKFTVPGAAENAETTLTVLKDGTTKTAHQVFDIWNSKMEEEKTITCNEATGDATVKGASQTAILSITPGFSGSCQFLGQEVTVENKGCNFEFTALGLLHIRSESEVAGKKCKHGESPIVFQTKAPLECKVEVAEQTVEGITYHNLADGTITLNVPEAGAAKLTYNATGKDCPFGTLSNGNFTTGNVIITGEKKGTTEMVNISWDKE